MSKVTYTQYSLVPWYRRSSWNTLFVFTFTPAVVAMLLTGDVYFKETGKDGNLKTWSVANKVVAVFLVLIWVMAALSVVGEMARLVVGSKSTPPPTTPHKENRSSD